MHSARLDRADLTSKECPISGTPAELPRWVLPSNGDVLRYWRLLLKNEQQLLKQGLPPSKGELYCKIAADVGEIWALASVPIIECKSISKRVNFLVEKFRALQKSMKRDVGKQAFEQKKLAFQDFLGKLFDICSRKCRMFEFCNCSKVYKVAKLEKAFLQDQRSCRKMMIGSIDPKETNRRIKKIRRTAKPAKTQYQPSSSQTGSSNPLALNDEIINHWI